MGAPVQVYTRKGIGWRKPLPSGGLLVFLAFYFKKMEQINEEQKKGLGFGWGKFWIYLNLLCGIGFLIAIFSIGINSLSPFVFLYPILFFSASLAAWKEYEFGLYFIEVCLALAFWFLLAALFFKEPAEMEAAIFITAPLLLIFFVRRRKWFMGDPSPILQGTKKLPERIRGGLVITLLAWGIKKIASVGKKIFVDEKVKEFRILIVIIIALLVFMFYWFEWRPSQIIKECNNSARQRVSRSANKSVEQYEIYYKICLRERGL